MQNLADAVFTLDDLRAYVRRILCEKEDLLADQFQMIESKLTRGSRDCGLQFRTTFELAVSSIATVTA